jgi:hypothetical protein
MEQARMSKLIRPEFAEVALWDDLRAEGIRYLKLANDAKKRGVHQADVNYITRCSLQCAEVIQQLSRGDIKFMDAMNWLHVFRDHYEPCEAIVYGRAS